MRIGIDIDDTICDSWLQVRETMCKDFKKNINEVIKSKKVYEQITDLSFDEYQKYAGKVFTKLLKDTPLKQNVKKVLDELSKENEIYFITARLDNCYVDAYKFSKEYLDKNEIPYKKIIANADEKDKICKELGIDIFIDDGRNNCEKVSKCGIKTIMFENYFNSDETRFQKIRDWNEMLDIVKEETCKKDYSKIMN